MWNTLRIRTLMAGFALTVAVWGMPPQLMAQDLTAQTQVVNDYLASLVNGDTQALIALIDGRMKQKSRHLVLNPDTYSQFLKEHYAGVQTTLEQISPEGDKITARVRFDYPTADSSVIDFMLTQVNGQWKITDEVF